MQKNRLIKTFIFIYLAVFVIFFQTFSLYFIQDDFFLLDISRADNLIKFCHLFFPNSEVSWYRPLSSQVFFFFGQTLFGLNPLPFHIIMFLTHLLNIYLVFYFVRRIINRENIAVLSALFYGLSSIHFITLAWPATYSFILGPTFCLLTLIFFIKKKISISVLFYLLGLLTSEVGLFVIFPILFYEFLNRKKKYNLIYLCNLLPYIIFIFIFIIFRKIAFPINSSGPYSFSYNIINVIFLLKFYFFRLIGVPMLIKSMSNVAEKTVIYSLSSLIIVMGFIKPIISFVILKIKKQKLPYFNLLIFSTLLFFSLISIFLLLPNHYSPHYLTFAFIGISLFLAIVVNIYNKTIRFLFIFSFILLQYLCVQNTYKTHWIISRAKLAQQLIKEKKLTHPVGSEEYFSLGADRAAAVFSSK